MGCHPRCQGWTCRVTDNDSRMIQRQLELSSVKKSSVRPVEGTFRGTPTSSRYTTSRGLASSQTCPAFG